MKTPKKISIVQIVRHLCQLAAFIIYPGLFASAFLAIKDVYTACISGKFVWSTQAPSVFLIVALFLVTVLLGRFFCGFICSFGALGDLLWYISSHTLKPRFRINRKADRILKYLKYVVLLVIVVVGWTLSAYNFDGYASPWTVFAMAASPQSWSNPSFLFTVGALILLLIMIASFFIERFFCRYLCPLGALFAVTSKLRLFRIVKQRRKCDKCRLCTYKCSMGIPLETMDVVRSGECIDCFNCTDVCPKKNASVSPSPLVTAGIAVAAMTGMVYGGSALSTQISASAVAAATASAAAKNSGTASQGTVSASTASNSTASSAVNSQGTGNVVQPSEYSAATNNSTADTAAAGDTAAADSAAANTAADTTADTAADSAAADTAAADTAAETAGAADTTAAATGQYTDGVYTGTGTGLRGTTEVSVTVAGGAITSIEIVSYQDDSQYFNRAQATVISEIIQSQGINVSTVSGATFSSNGILEAVANALGLEFTNPNSSMGGPGRN